MIMESMMIMMTMMMVNVTAQIQEKKVKLMQ